jgi:hypothetical protein
LRETVNLFVLSFGGCKYLEIAAPNHQLKSLLSLKPLWLRRDGFETVSAPVMMIR